MIWRFLRQFPKFLIAGLLIVASLATLFIWQARRSAREAMARIHPAQVEDTSQKVAKIELSPEDTLFVDNNLYNMRTGVILFRGWIKEDQPRKLFWEPDSKTVLAQYERGFVRYSPEGTEKGRFAMPHPFVLSDDYKWIVFAKNKDIWQADIDWQNLSLTNERQITHVEQFADAFFAESILLGTAKTLIVRAGMQVVRVNLDTGEVHPTRMPMLEISKRKSPNGESVVGTLNGQFYCLNVDNDLAKETPIGRAGINDYQWLGNDKCACIVDGKAVVLYDRIANTLGEAVNLPMPCIRIGAPSPDGRFAFCLGRGKGVLVDFEKKTAVPVTGGLGLRWITADTFAFSREIADSSLRGTWLQTVGENERRISAEPYLVHESGGEIMALKTAQLIVFATKHGLSKVNLDGTSSTETITLARPPALVLRMLDFHW